jgi:hypothetical protein
MYREYWSGTLSAPFVVATVMSAAVARIVNSALWTNPIFSFALFVIIIAVDRYSFVKLLQVHIMIYQKES